MEMKHMNEVDNPIAVIGFNDGDERRVYFLDQTQTELLDWWLKINKLGDCSDDCEDDYSDIVEGKVKSILNIE